MTVGEMIGPEIRRRREAQGMSVAQAAKLGGLFWQTWTRIENGVSPVPSLLSVLQICGALGCTPTDLLPGDWRETVASHRQPRGSKKGGVTDLVGQRFGRLLVLRLDDQRGSRGKARWVCRCDCQKIVSVYGGHLGVNSNSCGCRPDPP